MNRIEGSRACPPEAPKSEKGPFIEVEKPSRELQEMDRELREVFSDAAEKEAPGWLPIPDAFKVAKPFLFALAGAAIGGLAVAERMGPQEAGGAPEVALETVESQEAERVQQLQAVFDRAGEKIERSDQFDGLLSPEEKANLSQRLKDYPIEGVLDEFAAMGGVERGVILEKVDLDAISFYSDEDTTAFVDGLKTSGVTIEAGEEDVAHSHAARRTGMQFNGVIYLNLSKIDLSQPGVLEDVLTHEVGHTATETSHDWNYSEEMLSESFIELMAARAGENVDGISDAFPGYLDGPSVTAELLLAGTDKDSRLWQGMFEGAGGLQVALDDVYGAGTYDAFAHSADGYDLSPAEQRLLLVDQALQIMDYDSEIIAQANGRMAHEQIVLHSDGGQEAFLLLSDYSKSGHFGGMVRRPGESDKMVFVPAAVPEEKGVHTFEDYGGYVLGRLGAQGTPEGQVKRFFQEHDEDLNTFFTPEA